MVDLQPLFVAIRGACSNKTWSTGIELSRGDAVDGIEASDEEVTLRVKVPGRTVAPTVTLYPEDDEWDCDCGSSGDCCEHVAAAILALRQARKEGKRLPSSAKAGGRIGYRLSPEGERLVVARVAVTGDEETPIDGSLAGLLSGRESGPAVEPDSVDLTIDRLMSMNRVRALSADTVQSLLPLLAEAQDVTFEGAPVKVLAQGLGPTAIVTAAKKGGFRLRLEAPASFERVILPGLALTRGDEGLALRPLELTDLAGLRFEALPLESVYPAGRVAELIGEVLPRLRQHGEVDLRTSELPDRVRHVEARIVIDVEQKGGALSVLPVLVYGDPPCARVDGDELVHLAGPVPRRDKRAEERALRGLREALDLVPGRRVEVMGKDAVSLAHKLRSFQGTIHGDAHRRLYPKKPLSAELALDPGDFSARFVSGGAEADPEEVLRAYQRGQSVVPLLGGGWAELPASWLEQHGHRLAEILAARDAQGTVAPHARPVMAELCDALERPRPPALQALAPLLDGFESLPEAKLPKDLRADLRPYQHEGVAWLSFLRKAGLGAVLADDMGLGKTLQAIAALEGPTLVVAPRSVVPNWALELERFRPSLRVSVYHGASRSLAGEADVVLTTYALLRNDIDVLRSVAWQTVVLDESQAIKNPDSQVARAAFQLGGQFRITLSGTPVENRLEELWSQMHFANPGLLGGREDFRQRYERPMLDGEPGAAARLRARIKPVVLRRTKREVLRDLPPRTDAVIHSVLDEAEREVYDALQLATREEVLEQLAAGGSVMQALEALLRLRQAACDRTLVPGQTSDRPSSKVRRLLSRLDEAVADGHKSLVFSQWTSLLDRVEPELEARGIPYLRLDGQTRDRGEVVARFQSADGPPVLLISLRAGGTGLNLTAADHVFLLDPWWNPAVEDQAADRAHRIGQDRPVMVYRMVTKDTVEERILALQEAKRSLADAALGEADAATRLTRDDLLALLA